MARLLTAELVAAAPGSASGGGGGGGEWTHGMLQDWSSRLLFRVGLRLMFGEGLPADDLHQAFRDLDGSFPLIAANLPGTGLLLKKAFAGRDAIAAELARAQTRVDAPNSLGTVRHAYFMSKGYSAQEAATVNVLLVWALHANTSPAAFWALALTVNDPAARAAVRSEIDDLYERLPGWLDDPKQLGAALDSCPLVTSVMWEALRMSASSFGLRDAVADTSITLTRPPAAGPVRPGETPAAEENAEPTRIPAGSRVFMVTAHHTDEAVFPQAARFVYNRFAPTTPGGPLPVFKKDGRELRWPPVVPFGGGVSMCPGRFVAMNEIRVFLVLALRHRDFALVGPDGAPQVGGGVVLPPLDSTRAGLGVLPPVRDVPFAWRPRVR
jgi:cytochrome P450